MVEFSALNYEKKPNTFNTSSSLGLILLCEYSPWTIIIVIFHCLQQGGYVIGVFVGMFVSLFEQ